MTQGTGPCVVSAGHDTGFRPLCRGATIARANPHPHSKVASSTKRKARDVGAISLGHNAGSIRLSASYIASQ